MAGRRGNVRVSITGDSSGLGKATRDAENKLDRMDRRGGKALKALGTAAKAGGVALAAGLAVGAKKAADAAIEAEKAQARLNAQLDAIGQNSPKVRAEIDKVIQAQSQMSGFDDEDLQDSFVNIVRATGDVSKSLELNAVAMDLSRAKGLDLAKAGDLISKVAAGNTSSLSRYGIVLKEGATTQEALAAVQQKFSGQAEQYGKTTAGAVDRTEVAFENLAEVAGAALTPALASLANGLANFIGEVQRGEGTGGRFRDVMTQAFNAVVGAGRTVVAVGQQIVGMFGGVALAGGRAALDIAKFVGAVASSRAGIVALAAVAGALIGRFAAMGAIWAVGKIVAFVGAIRSVISAMLAARTASLALNKATLAGGFTALLSVVGTAVGAVAAFAGTQDRAAHSARDVADAVKAQREALKRLADLDLEATQRKVDLSNANTRVARAEIELRNLRRSGTASALDIKEAENTLRQARIDQERAQRNLNRTEGDARETRREAIQSLQDEIKERRENVKALAQQIPQMLLQGRSTDEISRKVAQARREQAALNKAIRDLRSKRVVIEIEARLTNPNLIRAFEGIFGGGRRPKAAPGAAAGGGAVPSGLFMNTRKTVGDPAAVGGLTTIPGNEGLLLSDRNLTSLLGSGGKFDIDIGVSSIAVAQAASTATVDDDVRALKDRIGIIETRIKAINRALKSFIKKLKSGKKKKRQEAAATLTRLYGEKAQLIDEINALNRALAELQAPPEPVEVEPADIGDTAVETAAPAAADPAPVSEPPAEPAAPDITADLRAQIDQANARAAVQAEKARLSEAAVRAFGSAGDIGTGGFANAFAAARTVVIQNVNALAAGSPETLLAVGQAATAGIGYQGTTGTPRAALGV